jgi:hypothetical protein
MGGCVGFTDGLGAVEKRKISFLYRELNPDYTD